MVRSDATDIVQCNNDNNDDGSPQICICNAVGNIEQQNKCLDRVSLRKLNQLFCKVDNPKNKIEYNIAERKYNS